MTRYRMPLRYAIPLLFGGAGIRFAEQFLFNEDATAPLGTPYTEGNGSLTLVQTDGEFSKSGGALVFPAQGTPVWGDQGFYSVASYTRKNGLAVIYKLSLSAISNGLFLGWTDTANANFSGYNDIGMQIDTASGLKARFTTSGNSPFVHAISTSTDYYIIEILRASGRYILLREATDNWQLLWVGGTDSTAALYFGLANNDAVGTIDMLGVIDPVSASLIPVPVLSDNFSDTAAPFLSDGAGHLEADGNGAGKTRNGTNWSSATNQRSNDATGGADVIITGDFASDSDWDKGTGWTIAAGVATKAAGTASDLGQTVDPLTAGIWYKLTHTVANRTAGTITPKFGTTAGVARSTNATFTEMARANAAAFDLSADSTFDGDEDDVIVNPVVIADLLDLVETGTAAVIYRSNLTITASTPGGVGVAWDSTSAPANGIAVYFNRATDKVIVEKWLAGVYDSELLNVAGTYSAAGTIEVRISDSDEDGTWDIAVWYDGTYKGASTYADADIIGNTIHGDFGLPEGGYAEKDNVWPADKGVTYDPLFART